MKKIIMSSLCIAFMSSCTVMYDFTVTNNPVGSKTGTSEQKFLFGSIPMGGEMQDAGYAAACKNGGITKVGLAEHTMWTNGLVVKKITTVYGD